MARPRRLPDQSLGQLRDNDPDRYTSAERWRRTAEAEAIRGLAAYAAFSTAAGKITVNTGKGNIIGQLEGTSIRSPIHEHDTYDYFE